MLKKTRNVLLGILAVLVGMTIGHKATRHTVKHMTQGTVMITNLAKNSGGSGVVLFSTPSFSRILTNRHVCEVVKDGGYVITEDGEAHLVTAYIQSELHDVCLIEVAADLHVNTDLAPGAPNKYESAEIIGHPNLYPTVITVGHFSGKQHIEVMTGVRECTEEEQQNPDTSLFCTLSGGIPIIKRFEAILVTATIMPGSSGSAIYNSQGQISALVFAGKGDLGYAFAVPYEYISMFLGAEIGHLKVRIPKVDVTKKSSSTSNKDRFAKACEKATTKYQLRVCKIVLDQF